MKHALNSKPLRLGTNETCDRCRVPGKIKFELISGNDLVFCGHHANQYAERLVQVVRDYIGDPDFSWGGEALLFQHDNLPAAA